jgi:hypothetical protein
MILTPIEPDALPAALARFAAGLADPLARAVFARLAVPAAAERAAGGVAARHHREAVALARAFGMGVTAGSPAMDYSWDGRAVRSETEAYVLLHEVAHFQLAAPARRGVVDFGLGPGTETGERGAAERAARLFGLAREREEAMASLLGMLWELALGHPALASFLDQNWLEGAGAPRHFETVLARLGAEGFIDADGRPTRRVRQAADAPAP